MHLNDDLLQHQGGANLDCDVDVRSGATWRLGIFNHYCAPFMRSQEAIALTTDRSVVASASPIMHELLVRFSSASFVYTCR